MEQILQHLLVIQVKVKSCQGKMETNQERLKAIQKKIEDNLWKQESMMEVYHKKMKTHQEKSEDTQEKIHDNQRRQDGMIEAYRK
jgi:chaperonin cofactor prefoldin